MYSLTGAPGTGKSTQVEVLQQAGYAIVSVGELLRQRGSEDILAEMRRGELADNDYVDSLISDRLAELAEEYESPKIILDGYPRALVQARWLLEKSPADLQACIFLQASDECIMERLLKRGRADDSIESIKRRVEIYKHNVGKILEYYGRAGVKTYKIEAEGTVEEVAAAIRKVLPVGESA